MAERELTAGVLAAISGRYIRPFYLFEGEYDNNGVPAHVRLFTGVGELVWDGKTWIGGGDMLSISPVRESASLEAISFTVTISGLASANLSLALQSMRRNKPGGLWLGFVEPDYVEFDYTEESIQPVVGAGVASVTVTRAGATATRINAQGLIEVVPANTARFDYDPVSLRPRGLLVEDGRTNLVTWSNDIQQSPWQLNNTTVDSTVELAPDGTNTARRIIVSGAEFHLRYQSATAKDGGIFSGSIYVRKVSGAATSVNMDLNDSTQSPGLVLTDQWQRLKYSIIPGGALTNVFMDINFNGDGTFEVWGAQLEDGDRASSLIPTAGAAVARNTDVPTVADISSFFNPLEGTLVAEWEPGLTAQTAYVMAFNNEARINIVQAASAQAENSVVDDTVFQCSLLTGSLVVGEVFRSAFAYKVNDFAASGNGGAVVTDNVGTLPGCTELHIGHLGGGSALNGHIRRLTYYPKRLSNELLLQLSAAPTKLAWSGARIVADPYQIRRGRFDSAPIKRDPAAGTMEIQLVYEGPLARLLVANERRYTHEDQQLRLVGDKGFDQVPELQDSSDRWGDNEWFQSLGLFGKIKVRQVQQ